MSAVTFLKRCTPNPVGDAFRAAIVSPSEWVLHPFDVLPSLELVSSTLGQSRVQYALAGTLARALYGFPRGIRTLELLVDLDEQQAAPLVQALRREQFVPASDQPGSDGKPQSVRLLSLPSLVCVECFFPDEPPFDTKVLTRTHPLVLDKQMPPVPVIAPEEIVLQGMVHYQATGACDDDLYNEMLGVLKIQAPTLDQRALSSAARKLAVQAVLAYLLEDAGIPQKTRSTHSGT
jgi:hypothetical protein